MDTSNAARLPVAVIGAGPVGLAAAAHLLARGETPLVLEAGGEAAASIRRWGHVRLFSPWKYLVDPAARALLEAEGWEMPDGERLPLGAELVAAYLAPLAAHPAVAPHVRYGHRVTGVSRRGMDRTKTAGREAAPFEVVARTADGGEARFTVRAVIDASGTYAQPNPMGAGGLPAAGEEAAADRVFRGIPDVLGRDRARYAGKRTLVVGSGHSAFNALLDLAALAEEAPGTSIAWAVRRATPGLMFGGGGRDGLAARGALGTRMLRLVEDGRVEMAYGFRASRISPTPAGLAVEADDGRALVVDEIVVATGFRPDLEILRELRLGMDPALESPTALAPLIDPNVHSCGTVYPHGAVELAHPERDVYVVGMKSYGRAPTFLLLTGYEQVRSVVAELAGDHEAARRVELVLPETGVCSTDLVYGGSCEADAPSSSCGTGGCGTAEPAPAPAAASCCGSAPALVTLSAASAGAASGGCCA